MLTKNCQGIGKKLASIVFVQAFSLDGDDIKWCNVAAWITAVGFESLSRRDPDRLRLKFRSTLIRMKRRNGRCRSSQVELTSKITPTTINSLQYRKPQWKSIFIAIRQYLRFPSWDPYKHVCCMCRFSKRTNSTKRAFEGYFNIVHFNIVHSSAKTLTQNWILPLSF